MKQGAGQPGESSSFLPVAPLLALHLEPGSVAVDDGHGLLVVLCLACAVSVVVMAMLLAVHVFGVRVLVRVGLDRRSARGGHGDGFPWRGGVDLDDARGLSSSRSRGGRCRGGGRLRHGGRGGCLSRWRGPCARGEEEASQHDGAGDRDLLDDAFHDVLHALFSQALDRVSARGGVSFVIEQGFLPALTYKVRRTS